jgi:ribulose-5-phosphate 4-epimerase/fuculose-1-phosphate aldolase
VAVLPDCLDEGRNFACWAYAFLPTIGGAICKQARPVSDPLDRLRQDLATAGRILANEGVLDGFGHVSARHPVHPDRFLLSRARAASLVGPEDILEFGPDSEPIEATSVRIFAERVIHGCIYRLRPDVVAVCHHHAPDILPFCVTGVDLVPVFHLGATMGQVVPFWDSQDEFGDTNLLVATQAQGLSMARALGANWTVLLRRHGATVAGRSVRELVFRSIYGARNAQIQSRAALLGKVSRLTPGEAKAAEAFNLAPIAVDRAWEEWVSKAG